MSDETNPSRERGFDPLTLTFEEARGAWPREVKYANDARREWNRAKARCGNALDFHHSVIGWLEALKHADATYVVGFEKWLRNDLWRQDPPQTERPAEPKVPRYDVDLDGNDLWNPENPGQLLDEADR